METQKLKAKLKSMFRQVINNDNLGVYNWNEEDHPRDEQGKFTNKSDSEYKAAQLKRESEPAKWDREPNLECEYRKKKWEEAKEKYYALKKDNQDYEGETEEVKKAYDEVVKAYEDLEKARKDAKVLNSIDNSLEQQFIDSFYLAVEEVLYENEVNNGWVTLKDKVDENGKPLRVYIPNYVPRGGAAIDFHEKMTKSKGQNIQYEYERTRAQISNEQKKDIETKVNKILDNYKVEPPLKGVNVCTIGGGCLGVAITSPNTRTLSLDSKIFKENGTDAFNISVAKGWLAKTDADVVTSVLTHELGHIITATSQNEKFWDRIAEIKSEYVKNVAKDDIKNKDYISKYARTNKDEFVAECFAQGTLSKNPSKYAKMVVDAINSHFEIGVKESKQLRLFNALAQVLNMKDDKTDENIIWVESDGAGYCLTEEDYEKRKSEVEEHTKKEMNK